jgi:hypothetical protein
MIYYNDLCYQYMNFYVLIQCIPCYTIYYSTAALWVDGLRRIVGADDGTILVERVHPHKSKPQPVALELFTPVWYDPIDRTNDKDNIQISKDRENIVRADGRQAINYLQERLATQQEKVNEAKKQIDELTHIKSSAVQEFRKMWRESDVMCSELTQDNAKLMKIHVSTVLLPCI